MSLELIPWRRTLCATPTPSTCSPADGPRLMSFSYTHPEVVYERANACARTNGRTSNRKDERTNERTIGRTNRRTTERMNEQTKGRTNRTTVRTNEQTKGLANKQMAERTNKRTNNRANERTDKRTREERASNNYVLYLFRLCRFLPDLTKLFYGLFLSIYVVIRATKINSVNPMTFYRSQMHFRGVKPCFACFCFRLQCGDIQLA